MSYSVFLVFSTVSVVNSSNGKNSPQRHGENGGSTTNEVLCYLNMFNVALVEPEIPPNTGNIARLCAATNTQLNIIGAAGFRLDDRAVRRAGLDYWPEVQLFRHPRLESLYQALPESRFLYFSTKAAKSYLDWEFRPNDCLIFGRETRGLPPEILEANWERALTIPMLNPKIRSLNLATAVAIVLYEALRQCHAFKSKV